MKKIILIILIFDAFCLKSKAQNEIYYEIGQSVSDSLMNGIKTFEKFYHKQTKDLKLFLLLVETNNELEFFLQEYSHLPPSGLREIIKISNRKLRINKTISIPILIPADKMSAQLKKDKIAFIPYSGYYIKVIYDNKEQKVVKTGMMF